METFNQVTSFGGLEVGQHFIKEKLMNHYTNGTTKTFEMFSGKTISSVFFPDDDEEFYFVRIMFTDGSHLELCVDQLTATLAISSKVDKSRDRSRESEE